MSRRRQHPREAFRRLQRRVGGSTRPPSRASNPRFLDYARVRGSRQTVACGVKKPHQKGRVERPIGFMRERFWPGRRFKDLFDLNRQAAEWRDDFANNRVHEITGRVPALVFARGA